MAWDAANESFHRMTRRQVARAGVQYAVVASVLMVWLIAQDMMIVDSGPLVLRKLIALAAVVVFSVLCHRLHARSTRILEIFHGLNLVLISSVASGVSYYTHVAYQGSPASAELGWIAMTGVVMVAFLNFLFSGGLLRWYAVHTGAPFVVSALMLVLVHDHSAQDAMEYLFGFAVVATLSVAAWYRYGELRRAFLDRQGAEENARYTEALFRLAPDPIIIHRDDGVIIDCNHQTAVLSGFSGTDVHQMRIDELICGTTEEAGTESMCNTRSGERVPVEVRKQRIDLRSGAVVLVAIRDLRERFQAIAQIRKLSVAFERSPAPVLITDRDGSIEYVNKALTELTGYSADELKGQNPRILGAEEQDSQAYAEMWATISSGETWSGEWCNRTREGRVYWESVLVAPIRDQKGHIDSYVAVKQDVTERRRREQHMQRLAFFDKLTGLANRAQILEAAHEALGRTARKITLMAIMYLDLNGFKPITVGVSIGVALYPDHGSNVGQLLEAADQAMYKAKRSDGQHYWIAD
ncbi:MAG: PAS domain S-box protein [Alkalispirochaeta sp.]